ncbi:MAG: hypothetical protein HZB67_01570 [Candidatus Aenigmarchaeota archaeon]|nr:hypothetical protein [Candidatus Aenigmarchaeota archaeon]
MKNVLILLILALMLPAEIVFAEVYGSAYSTLDIVELDNPVVSAAPDSQCGMGEIIYTVSVTDPTAASGVSSIVPYELSMEKPSGFDAGFLMPSEKLNSTYLLNVPIGSQQSVMFAVRPTAATEGNYQFKVFAKNSEHGISGEATLNYYYTKRKEPVVSITGDAYEVPAGYPKAFSVSIKNDDPSQCDDSVFYVTKIVPASWTATFTVDGKAADNLLIAPQATAAGILTIQSASNAKGEYNITLAVSRDTPSDFLKITAKSITNSGKSVYMTSGSAIKKTSTLGESATSLFEATGSAPAGVAADAQMVYWSDTGQVGIFAVQTDGTGARTVSSGFSSQQITIDSSYIYFTDRTSIKKVSKTSNNEDCSGDKCVVQSGLGIVNDIAADSGNLYWVEDNNKIRSSSNSGGSIEEKSTDSNVQNIVVSNGDVFYTARSPNRVVRCDIFFTRCRIVATGLGLVSDISADSDNIYWIESGVIKKISRDAVIVYGSAIFKVKQPNPPTVYIRPAVQAGPAGQQKIFYVNITNNAMISFSLNLVPECPGSWICEIAKSTSIPSGIGRNKEVELKVVPAADAAAGDYNIYINATSDFWTQTIRSSAKYKIGLHLAPKVEITPGSQTGYPGKELTYDINILNKDDSTYGSSQIKLTVQAPHGWAYGLGENMFSLEGGQSKNVTLKITSNRSAYDGSYTMRVNASIDNTTGFGEVVYTVRLCGDGICNTEMGETASTCSQDCWEPGYTKFACVYINALGLYECDNTTAVGVDFSSKVEQTGRTLGFVVCSRFSTQAACLDASKNNACGTGKSCLCSSGEKKCSIKCGDTVDDYYMLYKTSVMDGLSFVDLVSASPNYTFSCPYFGIEELKKIKQDWIERRSKMENAADQTLELFDDKKCYDANIIAAQKVTGFITYLDSVIANPTIESAAAARRNSTELDAAVLRIVSAGCLKYFCDENAQCSSDAKCNDNDSATIDICDYQSCSCKHLTQCPGSCMAECKDSVVEPCYRVLNNYGKIGCGNDYCCERTEVACPFKPPTGDDCPSGQIKNVTSGMCENAPDCRPGFYNVTAKKCQLGITCPAGSKYNVSLGLCIGTPVCPYGFLFDSSKQKCVGDPEDTTPPSCTEGFVYNSTTNTCSGDFTCESGLYDTKLKKCTQAPECPEGWFLNKVAARCEITPECKNGKFNQATGRCEEKYRLPGPNDCSVNISAFCAGGNVAMDVQWSGGLYAKVEVDGKQSDVKESKQFTYSKNVNRTGSVVTRVIVFDADDRMVCDPMKEVACRASLSCGYGEVYNYDTGACECQDDLTRDELTGECVKQEESSWIAYVSIIVLIPVLLIVAFYFREDIQKQLKRLKLWFHYKF